ncbi:MAG: hypothetical protein ACJAXN_000216 [Psychromonas sp.]|jgi:hypothetical protein
MITCLKAKIAARKAAMVNLNSKSDHFINAFGIIGRVRSLRAINECRRV